MNSFWDNLFSCFQQQTDVLEGKIEPNLTLPSYEELSSKLKWLHAGGQYSPIGTPRMSPYCIPTQNVAIIIPFRDREANLRVLLNNLHPILYRQQIAYTVYVIEQVIHVSLVKVIFTAESLSCRKPLSCKSFLQDMLLGIFVFFYVIFFSRSPSLTSSRYLLYSWPSMTIKSLTPPPQGQG
jgi:hypothetical protein